MFILSCSRNITGLCGGLCEGAPLHLCIWRVHLNSDHNSVNLLLTLSTKPQHAKFLMVGVTGLSLCHQSVIWATRPPDSLTARCLWLLLDIVIMKVCSKHLLCAACCDYEKPRHVNNINTTEYYQTYKYGSNIAKHCKHNGTFTILSINYLKYGRYHLVCLLTLVWSLGTWAQSHELWPQPACDSVRFYFPVEGKIHLSNVQ